MPRPSTIDQLPDEVRSAIATHLNQFESLNDILDALKDDFGVEVSRSALGRYAQRHRKNFERLKEVREASRQLALDLGEREGDQTFELMTEMLSNILYQFVSGQMSGEDEDAALNTGDFMKLAITLKTLAEAKIKDVNYRREIRQDVARQAAEAGGKAMREAGLSDALAEQIKNRILGVAD